MHFYKPWRRALFMEIDLSGKGQTILSKKSRCFRAKRRSNESFDHTCLCTLRFLINRLAPVGQSKTCTEFNVKCRIRATQLKTMKRRMCLSAPRQSVIYDVRYANIFMKVVLTTSTTPIKTWFYTECGLDLIVENLPLCSPVFSLF